MIARLAFLALSANFRRNAVRAENGARAGRHFFEFLDENGAQLAQFIDHVLVMDDFLAHIDRRAVEVQSDFDHIDGAHHAGAKTAGLEEVNLLFSDVQFAVIGLSGIRRLFA